MTTRTTQPPTKEQLDRIREVSTVVLGDSKVLFSELGEPETRWEASRMLGALHKIRNQTPGGSFEEKTLITQIEGLSNGSDEEKPVPKAEGDTKTCSSCGEEKPRSDFGRVKANPDGLNYSCKKCVRDRYHASKGSSKTEPPVATPEDAEPTPVYQWPSHFQNPTLDKLRLLSAFLDGASLDETAAVCDEIARAAP